eukprot:357613-Chlamydomonas_euryale.AAC.1
MISHRRRTSRLPVLGTHQAMCAQGKGHGCGYRCGRGQDIQPSQTAFSSNSTMSEDKKDRSGWGRRVGMPAGACWFPSELEAQCSSCGSFLSFKAPLPFPACLLPPFGSFLL